MLDVAALTIARSSLAPDDFQDDKHVVIARGMFALCDAGKHADFVLLCEWLRTNGLLQRAGGVEYLSAVSDATVTAAAIEFHVAIVLERSERTRLRRACQAIVEECQANKPVAEIMGMAHRAVLDTKIATHGEDPKLICQTLPETLMSIDERTRDHESITGVPTGFRDLDEKTLGFHRGELSLVAARPSNGKTAFMLRCARNAGRRGVPSLLISLEQSVQSINERYLSAESEMDGMDIRAGRLNGEDMVSLAKAGESLAALPIYQDDSARLNVFDVCLKIRRQRTKEPELALVFIDYVQKLKATHTVENPRLEQALAAELLREIATELNIAVVCLSQLKRPPQGSEGRRPFLSDVKESGAWEEASDLVLILHRPELTRVKKTKKGETEAPETAVGYAECLVAKQRNGPIGLVRLGFVKAQAKFQDWNSGQDGGGFEE